MTVPLTTTPTPAAAGGSAQAAEEAKALLASSAVFSLFSVPNLQTPDIPIPAQLPFPWSLVPGLDKVLLAAVDVHEAPMRFVSHVVRDAGGRWVARNRTGQSLATVQIRWTPIPESYRANAEVLPPQTILNPFVSQRFEMLDGQFQFADDAQSGFNGFGAGRTFPAFDTGFGVLRIGAVIDIVQGIGALAGVSGTVVVNGQIKPPNELDLNLMARVWDTPPGMVGEAPLPPLVPVPFPDPGATFMWFLGESDPARPPVRRPPTVEGSIATIELDERLRRVDLDFDVVPDGELKSQVAPGPAVGRARQTLHLFPSQPGQPLSTLSTGGVLELEGTGGGAPSTIGANLVEGRMFAPRAGSDLWRLGGFGPLAGGSGEFAGATGMLSLNAGLTSDPAQSSTLYVVRFVDPEGCFRAPWPAGEVP